MHVVWLLVVAVFLCLSAQAQQAPPIVDPAREMNERLARYAEESRASAPPVDYQVGPEDVLEVSVLEVPELSKTVRISASGDISLFMLGTVKVAGLSAVQIEEKLKGLLAKTYMRDPQVTVFVKEFKSAPVSVLGAVRMPGSYYVQGRRTLIEVLAQAGGFATAGKSIVVVPARREPLSPGESGAKQPPAVEVPIKELLQSGDPKWNIPIYPGDVIKVVAAGTVYVAGSVTHAGAFPLTDFDNISALQALALAGGTTRSASRKNALIISRDASGKRTERKIDLAKVLRGQDDAQLGPNDILFVPGSLGKESALRALESSISAAGLLLLRY